MTEDRQGLPPVGAFEDLEVFKRAYRLSLDVHRLSLGLAGDRAARRWRTRSGAASKSICANLAEGLAGKACNRPTSAVI